MERYIEEQIDRQIIRWIDKQMYGRVNSREIDKKIGYTNRWIRRYKYKSIDRKKDR